MSGTPTNRPMHALIMHGLNNNPETMVPIANRLDEMGIGATFGKLTGHWEKQARIKSFRSASAKAWLQDAENIYSETARAQNDKDLILVGYSLGALLGVLLAQSGKAKFKAMVLFAPALYLHPWSYFPKLLPFNLNLPSAMPSLMRANPGTPVNAYCALFNLVKQFDPAQLEVPILIVMNPQDELVNFSKVKSWADKQRNASVLPLQNTSGIKHLITDEIYVGATNWKWIWKEIESFIGLPAKREND